MNTLVIFSGLPGTGKSTLAERLARELRWPLLCVDDVLGDAPENPPVAFWDARVAILLRLVERQLELGLSVIVDSVFMNTDRHHARSLARTHQAWFRPIYVYMSNERLWQERVTKRFNELNHPDVATWERIQRQRGHFRPWQPGTALFVDAVEPVEQNYAEVLRFVTAEEVALQPLEEAPWATGNYHV